MNCLAFFETFGMINALQQKTEQNGSMKYEASESGVKKKISDHAVLINRAEIAIRVGQSCRSRVDKCFAHT